MFINSISSIQSRPNNQSNQADFGKRLPRTPKIPNGREQRLAEIAELLKSKKPEKLNDAGGNITARTERQSDGSYGFITYTENTWAREKTFSLYNRSSDLAKRLFAKLTGNQQRPIQRDSYLIQLGKEARKGKLKQLADGAYERPNGDKITISTGGLKGYHSGSISVMPKGKRVGTTFLIEADTPQRQLNVYEALRPKPRTKDERRLSQIAIDIIEMGTRPDMKGVWDISGNNLTDVQAHRTGYRQNNPEKKPYGRITVNSKGFDEVEDYAISGKSPKWMQELYKKLLERPTVQEVEGFGQRELRRGIQEEQRKHRENMAAANVW